LSFSLAGLVQGHKWRAYLWIERRTLPLCHAIPSPTTTDPVNIEGEPEDVLKVLLGDEVGDGNADEVEPKLDE
jgi:hypothetical protein